MSKMGRPFGEGVENMKRHGKGKDKVAICARISVETYEKLRFYCEVNDLSLADVLEIIVMSEDDVELFLPESGIFPSRSIC